MHTAITKDLDLKKTLSGVETAEKIKDEEARMIEAIRQTKQEMKALPPPPPKDGDSSSNEGVDIVAKNEEEPEKKSEETEEEQTTAEWIFSALRFTWKLCTSTLHYLSAFFNRHSKEHRYVAYVLDKEKIRLKHVMADVSLRLYSNKYPAFRLSIPRIKQPKASAVNGSLMECKWCLQPRILAELKKRPNHDGSHAIFSRSSSSHTSAS